MRKLFEVSTILTALFCGTLFAQQAASGNTGRTYVEFEPLDTITVRQGEKAPMEFKFHIHSGYFINSSQPTSPELILVSLGFTPPPDLVIAKMRYPAGRLTSFPFDPTQIPHRK